LNQEKYHDLSNSGDFLELEFHSEGTNRDFTKIVPFTQTANTNIFNLGFDDRLENGVIDDLVWSNNQDT
jgi:phosphoribosylamine-glycine ligase